MKKLWARLLCAVLLASASLLAADESLPPIPVGSGQSVTQVTNGQTVTLTANGVQVTVNFTEISSTRVTGSAHKTDPLANPGTGSLTVRWVNRGLSLFLSIGPGDPPPIPFGMEGGDGDKRAPKDQVGG